MKSIVKKLSLIFGLLGVIISTEAQKTSLDMALNARLDKVLVLAGQQYHLMGQFLTEDRFPKTYHEKTSQFESSSSDWWCSGFYPGSLLYLYEFSKEQSFLKEAERIMKVLEKEQYNTGTHDLGFMMYCSFGNALKIAPKPEYNDILIQSARSLITRFDKKVGLIKSWDSTKGDYLVIIDNMMNLELLFWASEVTGDPVYKEIAITHTENTIKNHYRKDYSSYHVINYNPLNGDINKKMTAQGYADESAWARGQAWGLYGFVSLYRLTKNQKYLSFAQSIADFLLNHPNLPQDKIPYWDFNAPNIPDALRDSSAGAIMSSALFELSTYTKGKKARKYFSDARLMLSSLSQAPYLAETGTNGGFFLKHGVGHFPQKTEVDTPLTYGDYYFLEAIKRYKALIMK